LQVVAISIVRLAFEEMAVRSKMLKKKWAEDEKRMLAVSIGILVIFCFLATIIMVGPSGLLLLIFYVICNDFLKDSFSSNCGTNSAASLWCSFACAKCEFFLSTLFVLILFNIFQFVNVPALQFPAIFGVCFFNFKFTIKFAFFPGTFRQCCTGRANEFM